MKLKFYLRGIGIGVLLSTIIFAIAIFVQGVNVKTSSVTEEKTTSSVLAYTTAQSAESTTAQQATTIATVAETKKEEDAKEESKETEAKTTAKVSVGDKVTVEIKNFQYLSEVSEILYEKGVISDIIGFNQYMTETGNDTKVWEGTYELKAGDTFENIADVITRN